MTFRAVQQYTLALWSPTTVPLGRVVAAQFVDASVPAATTFYTPAPIWELRIWIDRPILDGNGKTVHVETMELTTINSFMTYGPDQRYVASAFNPILNAMTHILRKQQVQE